VFERFAEPDAVVVAGQRVMVGEEADFLFGPLAIVDIAHHTGQPGRASRRGPGNDGAFLDPDKLSGVVAQA